MRKQYPSEAAPRFMVRLPDDMRDKIKAAAKKANRTMNAEIVHRLEASFVDEPMVNTKTTRNVSLLTDLEHRLARLEVKVNQLSEDFIREC